MKVLFAFLFLIVLFVPNDRASADNTEYDMHRLRSHDNIDVYDFPVVPGTPEWKEMEERDRRKATQIPDSVLSTISTLGLAWTCLKHPDRHFWVFSSIEDLPASLPSPKHKPLGHRWDLLQRRDAGSAILKIYQALDPTKLDPNWPRIKKTYFLWDFALLEAMLSIPEVLACLSKEEKQMLLALCSERYSTRLRQHMGTIPIHLILGRLLVNLKYKPFLDEIDTHKEIQTFLDFPSGVMSESKLNLPMITHFVEQFLSSDERR